MLQRGWTCKDLMGEAKIKLYVGQSNKCNLDIQIEVLCDGLPTGQTSTEEWEGECDLVVDLGTHEDGRPMILQIRTNTGLMSTGSILHSGTKLRAVVSDKIRSLE
jgi:hypothetical protein